MKKNLLLSGLFLFFIFSSSMSQTATPPTSGDGSEHNPYQIATLDNLYWLSQNSDEWNKYFVQTADIDASATSGWDGGKGFQPIGSDASTKFTGTYHGHGHIISSLTIHRSSNKYIGLFGYTEGAIIDSLGVTNIDLEGDEYIGGIVGFNRTSTVSYCFATGTINGSKIIGGLVGNNSGSTISNCYARVDVSSSSTYTDIGGLAGINIYSSTIDKCYSTGKVTGIDNMGGLTGRSGNSVTTNSFWDTLTSGQNTSAGGTGVATADLKNCRTFTDTQTEGLNDAWDFPGKILDDQENNDLWGISDKNDQYPILTWEAGGNSLYALVLSEKINNITSTTATGVGNVVFLGSSDPTGYGLCWNTSGNPTLADNSTDKGALHDTGSFSSQMTGLTVNTTYYVRTYVTNTYGTYYGKILTFTAGQALVTSDSVLVTDENTATGYGNIISLGAPDATAYGFCWNTTGNPTISDQKSDEGNISATGTFSTTLTGLKPGLIYYARAYVTNANGTSYGEVIEFRMALPPEGKGTESNPYRIASLGNLYWLSMNPSEWDKHYIQTADINAGATSGWDGGKGFSSIGNAHCFTGSYNGQEHIIDSLYINRPLGDKTGFFGWTENASIKNLGITNASVTGKYYTGILAGETNLTEISNCFTTGIVSGLSYQTGGLIGGTSGSTLTNCYSQATVIGHGYKTGGLLGSDENSSYLRNCYSTGPVTGDTVFTGGLTGNNKALSVIENCFSTSNVTGKYRYTGGLAGCNDRSNIFKSYSTGDVTGDASTAGFIGEVVYNTSEISNCYSTGHVTATGTAGGFIAVSASTHITNSFWDTETSGMTTSGGGGTGLTTYEMTLYYTYTDTTTQGLENAWDFVGTQDNDTATADLWCLGHGHGYPVFTWQDSLYALASTDSLSNIEATRATVHGTIFYTGSASPTAHGFCWNTTGEPDLSDQKLDLGSAGQTGPFSASVTGLTTGTTYYVRSFVTNAYGTSYGKVLTFVPGKSYVKSLRVTHITDSNATAVGSITTLGASPVTAHGFCWNTTGNPTLSDNKTDEGATSQTGEFTTVLKDLQSNVVYYARAYVTNSYGTSYGKVIRFQKLPPPAGSGTEADPYRIATLGNLRWLSETSSAWDKCFVQTADIDASETVTWNDSTGFSPIGNDLNYFTGCYHGNGHYIRGLYINRPDDKYIGLFGYTSNNATIDSLMLDNVNITGKTFVGGLVGDKWSNTTVSYCSSSGRVTGEKYVGGLIGYNAGKLNNSYSRGVVIVTDSYGGGLVGSHYQQAVMENCYSRATVDGATANTVGGLAGYSNWQSVINNCYSTGKVTGTYRTGGLVGYHNNPYIITNSFWDTETSEQTSSVGGTGLTTAEMKDFNTFTCLQTEGLDQAWDFTGRFYDDTATADLWSLGAGNDGYLSLAWEDSLYAITSTDSIRDVRTTAATGHATLISLGSADPTDHGFCWNTTGDPTLADQKASRGPAQDTGAYAAEITNLTTGTLYYTRAFATNQFGTFYGEVRKFTAGVALVFTDSIGEITVTTAKGYGYIPELSDSHPTHYGFCWNTSGDPDINDYKTDEGHRDVPGSFTTTMTGLFPGMVYYAKAYVTNAAGTFYGDEISFVYAPQPQGAGTASDPYLIQNLGNLRWMTMHPEEWDKEYRQIADIQAATTAGWEADSGFIPLGNETQFFSGKYHGGGHLIDSLVIQRPDTDYVGLFGYLGGATIDSLNLSHAVITGRQHVGILAGRTDNTVITHCSVNGIVYGTNHTGGLVGWNSNSSEISFSASQGEIHAGTNGGGLVGYNYNNAVIHDCFSTANIFDGTWYIGGLAGYNRKNATISNCYSRGNIIGRFYTGGFVGWNIESSVISNSYSTGHITGETNVGGFVGANSATISNSFWDLNTSGISKDMAATGKTTAEMKDFYTFTDTLTAGLDSAWDFTGIVNDDIHTEDRWGISSGNDGYLSLSWQDSLLAILTNDSITDITTTSATGYGTIIFLGDQNPSAHGFCWNTTGDPVVTDSRNDLGTATNTGPFYGSITGLTEGTTYYIRPFITNAYGTFYGREKRLVAGAGRISFDSTGNITDTTVTLYGTLLSLGADNPSSYGFCWNTTGEPSLSDHYTDNGPANKTGSFTDTISGSFSGMTIYIRAYVTNSSGIYYGNEFSLDVVTHPAGTGTNADPYRIASLGNLRWVTDHPGEWGKIFLQTKDIDASDTRNWNDGQGYSPIGNESSPFTGQYKGHGHTIRNLYINRPQSDNTGLFGFVKNALIDSLGLINFQVTGNNKTGGLAGSCYGMTINSCFITGKINGTGNHTGGVAGQTDYYSYINNCYNKAEVNGTDNVGGLVGWNSKDLNVVNSYSAGKVTASNRAGGLIGFDSYRATINNSFWDIQSSGVADSDGGTGKLTAEMKDPATFTLLTTEGLAQPWDLTGTLYDDASTKDMWGFRPGNDGYLALTWQDSIYALVITEKIDRISNDSATIEGNIIYAGDQQPIAHGFCWNTTGRPDLNDPHIDLGSVSSTGTFSAEITGLSSDKVYFLRSYVTNEYGTYYDRSWTYSTAQPEGSGTSDDPYRIATLGDLFWLSSQPNSWDKYFIQTDDINAAATSLWNMGKGFEPIGNTNKDFGGHYSGGGHIIDSLFIWHPQSNFTALFGWADHAYIDSLGLTHVRINGKQHTGALIGYGTSSKVYYCFSDGTVQGTEYVGGLTGDMNNWSSIANCYSRSKVVVSIHTGGGLLGFNGGCTIVNAYSTGNVQGPGTATNLGGLVGGGNTNVTQSFWDTISSGISTSMGGIGKSTSDMTNLCTYVNGIEASWDFMEETVNGTKDFWGMNDTVNNGYPFLSWEGYEHTAFCCFIDTSVTQNGITLTANASENVTYQWVDCNNGYAIIPGETGQSFTAQTNGSYAVIITNTTCSLSDTSFCHAVTTVGIEKNDYQSTILVYPNPAKDKIHIASNDLNIKNIAVLDLTGKVVKTATVNEYQTVLDMSGCTKGLYLIRIITNKGTVFKRIMIK